MRNLNCRQKLISALLAGSSFFVGCTSPADGNLKAAEPSFKLVDGSAISDAAYDDYSPIIVRLSNNYLALVFGSTRTCSQGCTAHNIFVAVSVAPYADTGTLPAFSPPQPAVMNGVSPLAIATKPRLAVVASGTSITIYVQTAGTSIKTTGSQIPVAGAVFNVPSGLMPINDNYCYMNDLLGMDATGMMIAANTAGTQTYRFNPNAPSGGSCPTAGMTNPKLATGTHISLVRQTSTGIPDSFIVSDTSGKISAQTVTSDGPQLALLKDGLQSNSLVSTGVSVMQGATAAGDLITFSAAPAAGQKSDLYVLLSPKPAALWLSYVSFGQQPVP